MTISASEIEQARSRLSNYLTPTPIQHSRYFSGKTGAEVYLKLEILQPTHSFKVRGALNAILALDESERRRGIVCASGGNHGLGVALACNTLNIPCAVYLPVKTPEIKIEAIQELGAAVILHGNAWDEANARAMDEAKEQGLAYIHPFNDPLVMAGQATIGLELIDQLRYIDMIIASIGGGGLTAGIVSAVKHFSPQTKVIGVETKGADSMYQSIQAGKIVELPAITSIAESLGARKTEPMPYEIVSKNIEEVLVVSDEEAIASLIELLKQEKLLVEPATSCSLAALTSGKIKYNPGDRIAVVLCGANVAMEKVALWLNQ